MNKTLAYQASNPISIGAISYVRSWGALIFKMTATGGVKRGHCVLAT